MVRFAVVCIAFENAEASAVAEPVVDLLREVNLEPDPDLYGSGWFGLDDPGDF